MTGFGDNFITPLNKRNKLFNKVTQHTKRYIKVALLLYFQLSLVFFVVEYLPFFF